MSLFRKQRAISFLGPTEMVRRGGSSRSGSVTPETAMRNSAVWACLRLRANLISSCPVDAYRRVGKIQVEVEKPPVLIKPAPRVTFREHMFSSQMDLDRYGNSFGIIVARDGLGLPAVIHLVSAGTVAPVMKDGELVKWRIAGVEYDLNDVWHEKQYTVPGSPVGLSPVAYAAWTLGEFTSIQQFATDWFDNGTLPAATLKNTKRVIEDEDAAAVKKKYKASVSNGDVFVMGSDWEFDLMKVEAAGSNWIEAKQFGISDIARFFDAPGDVIDAAVSGSSVTYANIIQRNLQLLIMHIGPAVARREDALSDLLASPRFAKLNTDALLRMDPIQRGEYIRAMVAGRLMAPSEGRELDNRQPFTDAQLAEFDRLWGAPKDMSPGTSISVSTGTPEQKQRDVAETLQKAYLAVGKVITSDEARELANKAGANLPIPGPDFDTQAAASAAPTPAQEGNPS